MSRPRAHRGLTLLEVIVAMTVLAIGIAGVLGAISACLRTSTAAAEYSRGALLAQQVAAELDRNESLEAGDLSGTFDDAVAGYSWTAEVDSADDNGLYPVKIRVEWRNGAREFELYTQLRPHALLAPPTPPAENENEGTEAPPTTPPTPPPAGNPTPGRAR